MTASFLFAWRRCYQPGEPGTQATHGCPLGTQSAVLWCRVPLGQTARTPTHPTVGVTLERIVRPWSVFYAAQGIVVPASRLLICCTWGAANAQCVGTQRNTPHMGHPGDGPDCKQSRHFIRQIIQNRDYRHALRHESGPRSKAAATMRIALRSRLYGMPTRYASLESKQ